MSDTARQELLSARLVAIFVIFALSLLGFVLPILMTARDPHTNFGSEKWRLVKSLSSGIILGVAFLHLLPESNATISELMEYPLTFLLVLVGFMITLGLEHSALAMILQVNKHKQALGCADDKYHLYPDLSIAEMAHDHDHNRSGGTNDHSDCAMCKHDQRSDKSLALTNGHDHAHGHDHSRSSDERSGENTPKTPHSHQDHRVCAEPDVDEKYCHHIHIHSELMDKDASKAFIKALIMEGSIAIHSIIIGFDLGVLPASQVTTIKVLTVAFSFHQFFEGISLGTSMVHTNLETKSKWLLAVLFALTLPIGIFIGIGVNGREDEDGSTVAAVASAVAAGSLMYSGFIELVAEDFSDPYLSSRFGLKSRMFLSLIVGIAVMAILAVWA